MNVFKNVRKKNEKSDDQKQISRFGYCRTEKTSIFLNLPIVRTISG